jgi:hypothetical protein
MPERQNSEQGRAARWTYTPDGRLTRVEVPPPPERIPEPKRLNPNFFRRENDGTVRVRLRFTAEEAAVIEKGAGEVPVIDYLYRIINRTAARDADQAQRRLNAELPAPAKRQEKAANG